MRDVHGQRDTESENMFSLSSDISGFIGIIITPSFSLCKRNTFFPHSSENTSSFLSFIILISQQKCPGGRKLCNFHSILILYVLLFRLKWNSYPKFHSPIVVSVNFQEILSKKLPKQVGELEQITLTFSEISKCSWSSSLNVY